MLRLQAKRTRLQPCCGPLVQRAAGPLQLCAGQSSGVEAAIHAMRTLFTSDDAEGMLLVDASNAFNSLNRAVALQNIQYICPRFLLSS